jgi:hypothetical protein
LFGLSLIWLFVWLARRQPLEIKLAVIGFAVFILSNNTLAAKSQDTVLFIATVMGASAWAATETRLHRAERYLQDRQSVARVGRRAFGTAPA